MSWCGFVLLVVFVDWLTACVFIGLFGFGFGWMLDCFVVCYLRVLVLLLTRGFRVWVLGICDVVALPWVLVGWLLVCFLTFSTIDCLFTYSFGVC